MNMELQARKKRKSNKEAMLWKHLSDSWNIHILQFSSVVQSSPILCDLIHYSVPGFPVHHQLLELAQTHVSDAIQQSHPLSSPSPPAFNLSQHQGLFQWVNLKDFFKSFSSVQSLSLVLLFATPWIAALQASLSIINSQSSLKLTSNESVMPSSHLILCHPLLLLHPIPPSIRVLSNESTLHIRWPKYCSFSFASFLPKKSQGWSPSEWTGLISLQSKGLSRVFSNTAFKSINSLVLSFLHSPTLTSIHEHWKNHSLD